MNRPLSGPMKTWSPEAPPGRVAPYPRRDRPQPGGSSRSETRGGSLERQGPLENVVRRDLVGDVDDVDVRVMDRIAAFISAT